MHQVNIEEAKDHLPELIDAAIKGEQIVITKDDQNRVLVTNLVYPTATVAEHIRI